jgi:hypothetical protein
MTRKQRITERYDTQNVEAACIIAADSATYPEGSLPAVWAELLLSKAAAPAEQWEAGPLFRQGRAA